MQWCNVNRLNVGKTKEMIVEPKSLGDYSQ